EATLEAALHTIPNFAFSKVSTRVIIRVFLPWMYGRESKGVPSTDLALIYNACLHPLRQPRQDSPRVPGRSFPQAERAGTMLRGWKGATAHDPEHLPDKVGALEDLTQVLDMPRVIQEEWQVDVALEIGHPGRVVAWKTSRHGTLLSSCLPSLGEGAVEKLMDGTRFTVDPAMHLKDISGFRCSPGTKGRGDHTTFIQAYLTKKTMAYQQHQGFYNNIQCNLLLASKHLDQLVKDMDQMSRVIHACSKEAQQGAGSQDGCARIEVRAFPWQGWNNVYWPFPRVTGGYFKLYRLAAMYLVMKNLSQVQLQERRSKCTLVLGGITMWLLDGLFHCPQAQCLKLVSEACQEVPKDYEWYDEDAADEEDRTPLMYDAGLYFICDIVVDQSRMYRLPYHKSFSNEAITSAFRVSMREIREAMLVPLVGKARPVINPEQNSNRSRKRTLHVDDIRDEDCVLPVINAEILEGVHLRPAQRMRGEDVVHFHTFGGGNRLDALPENHRDDAEEALSIRVQKLLEQFFFDILQQALNHRSASEGSWTNIPKDLCMEYGTEQLYQAVALPFTAA
ncbi:hypothetical protein PAXRUDRAFT_29267, partial [Paxillus rubicundulus Ve08.2h10]